MQITKLLVSSKEDYNLGFIGERVIAKFRLILKMKKDVLQKYPS